MGLSFGKEKYKIECNKYIIDNLANNFMSLNFKINENVKIISYYHFLMMFIKNGHLVSSLIDKKLENTNQDKIFFDEIKNSVCYNDLYSNNEETIDVNSKYSNSTMQYIIYNLIKDYIKINKTQKDKISIECVFDMTCLECDKYLLREMSVIVKKKVDELVLKQENISYQMKSSDSKYLNFNCKIKEEEKNKKKEMYSQMIEVNKDIPKAKELLKEIDEITKEINSYNKYSKNKNMLNFENENKNLEILRHNFSILLQATY